MRKVLFLHRGADLAAAAGNSLPVNNRLVRGLDYYGHTAFEITSDQLGAQATVCGGGRYDGLVEQLGGSSTPAIGWALGMERLLLVLGAAAKADLMERQPGSQPGSPHGLSGESRRNAEAAALCLARNLRQAGVAVEWMALEQHLANSSSARTDAAPAGRCSRGSGSGTVLRVSSLRADSEEQTFALDAIPALLEAFGYSLKNCR